MNDYDKEIVLVAFVASKRFGGSSGDSLSTFAEDLFKAFDQHIRDAAATMNPAPGPRERSVIASLAVLIGGIPRQAALDAVATYRRLFAH